MAGGEGGGACSHWAPLDSMEQVIPTGRGCHGSLGVNAGHKRMLR